MSEHTTGERLCWSSDLLDGSHVCICDSVIVSLRYTTGERLIICDSVIVSLRYTTGEGLSFVIALLCL